MRYLLPPNTSEIEENVSNVESAFFKISVAFSNLIDTGKTTLRLYIGVPGKIYLRVLLCPFCIPFLVEFDLIISPFFTFVGAIIYACFFVSGLKTLAKNPDRFASYSIPTIIPCVSALIHAATMVFAGVFLLARCSPLLEYCPGALVIISFLYIISSGLPAPSFAFSKKFSHRCTNYVNKKYIFSYCSSINKEYLIHQYSFKLKWFYLLYLLFFKDFYDFFFFFAHSNLDILFKGALTNKRHKIFDHLFDFTETLLETAGKSLHHSCGSELTRQGISLP